MGDTFSVSRFGPRCLEVIFALMILQTPPSCACSRNRVVLTDHYPRSRSVSLLCQPKSLPIFLLVTPSLSCLHFRYAKAQFQDVCMHPAAPLVCFVSESLSARCATRRSPYSTSSNTPTNPFLCTFRLHRSRAGGVSLAQLLNPEIVGAESGAETHFRFL